MPKFPGLALAAVLVIAFIQSADARLMTLEEAREEEVLRAKWDKILAQSDNAAHTNDLPTLSKLRRISLIGAQWNGTDIHAVVKDLEARSREADPEHGGIHFSVVLPTAPASQDSLGREITTRVYIIISSKKTLTDLVAAISEQTNLCYKVEKDHVTFLPWQPDSFVLPPQWMYLDQ